MGLYVCRLLTVLGLLLLLAGSAAIIIGYCLPQEQNIEGELMRISIDQDEEGNFYVLPERLTEVMAQLQDPMHKWKMIGQLFPLPLPLPSHCHPISSNAIHSLQFLPFSPVQDSACSQPALP
jgi:hypothetical protein